MEPFPSPSSFWFRTEKFYFQAGGSENRGLPAHGPGLGSALRSHVILGSRHSLPVSGCSPAKTGRWMMRRRGLAIESSPRFLTEWLVLTAHVQQPHLAQNEFSSGAESWGRGQVWRSSAFPCGRSCPDRARFAMEIQTHYLIPGQTGARYTGINYPVHLLRGC